MGTGQTGFDEGALLVRLLSQEGFAVEATSGLAPRSLRDPAPAGPAQRRFWIQEQVEGTAGLNNLGCLLRFGEALDPQALERALAALAARHEALRTRFEERGGEVVEIVEAPQPPALQRIGAGDDVALRNFTEQPFRLDEAPLWRAALLAGPDLANVLLFSCHHAVLDWSGARRLAEELRALYTAELSGTPATLPAAALQQADYAHWLRSGPRRTQAERDRRYWRRRLAPPPPPLELPAALHRDQIDGNACRAVALELDEALTAEVRRFAAGRRTTIFMVLLAAYAAVLGRFAGAEKVCVGTSIDNRDGPASEAIVGCLMDMLPLSCDLSGELAFGALVERIHLAGVKDLEHKALGFAELVELAEPERRPGVMPLFQAIFNLLPAAAGEETASPTPIPPSLARADLALELRDEGARIAGPLEYREGLIPPAVGEAIGAALLCLLRHGLADPERPAAQLPLIEPAAAEALLDRLNPPIPAPPSESLGALFVARAQQQPGTVALIEGEHSITYGALLDRSTALAEHLVEAGLRPGQPVAICLKRSIELAVALLAAIRAGAAALLLDPDYPDARLAEILADSKAPFLIGRQRPSWLPNDAACRLLEPTMAAPKGLPLPKVRPQDAACLVYTSGSTGHPKGVIGLHRGMVNRLQWMWRAFPFGPDELSIQKTSPAFVDYLWELFGPLLGGVPSVIADAMTARDPQDLTALIAARRVTRIALVPSLLRAWLDSLPDLGERLASLRVCVSSGEALPADLAARFRALLPGCRLLNLYGSSEVSADSTWYEVQGGEAGRIPIGRPIPGNHVAVLDAAGQALPPGAPGEILVRGLGVARGYLGAPAMTAARFGGLGSEDPAAPFFRSGDLGFWDGEGRLVYLGRRDRQVKLHGIRVEPGEIEVALAQHSNVREVHVLAYPPDGATALIAYLAGEPGLTAAALRTFLTGRLPRALVPAAFVILECLPLTPSGKLDVAALPPPQWEPATPAVRHALDPLEQLVAEAWASVLGRTVASADADFFSLGGSSLQAILATTRMGEALGRSLPVAWLFETPRLAELARRLTEGEAADSLPPPLPEASSEPAPATGNQAWLWEAYRQDPTRIAYNLPLAYHLEGLLDTAALEGAVGDLFTRHESLRTRLAEGPEGLLQLVDPAPASPLRCHDFSGAEDPEAALRALIASAARRPFALDRDLPFRAELVRLGNKRHCLVMVLHHVASDGWSGQVLVEELAALYRARHEGTPTLPAPPLQCGDVARWQRRIRPLLASRLESYRKALAGAEAPRLAGLCTQMARGGPVAVEPIELEPAQLARFRRLGQELHATPFLAMLAAWAALLARFGDCEQPLISTPLAGRGRPGLQSVVGFLANPVLLRVDLRDSPAFAQVVEATRDALLAGLRHQEMPLAWIQEDSDALHSMFVMEKLSAWDLTLPGLACRLAAPPQSPEARVDIALVVTETPEGARIQLEYAERRVPATLARRLARGLRALIAGACADPATPLELLPLLDGADGAAAISAPAALRPAAQRLDVLLTARAATDPAAIAATDGRTVLTYAELQRRAEGLAGRLQALGVRPGDRVGLIASASPHQCAGLLGIWRAGATAVPLDPGHPRARIDATLTDAAVTAAITEAPLDYPCPQLRPDETGPACGRDIADEGSVPAAVIYTSGTSGRPRGVLVAQEALCRLGAALAEAYALHVGDRVLQVVSPAFDVALSDLAMTLSAGATLVAAPREAVLPGSSLLATLEREAITHLQIPAAMLAATTPPAGPDALAALHVVAVGGEVCPPETARRWAAGRRLFVAYGPSEATVTATLAEYDGKSPGTTIGRPFCSARLQVLDPAGEPLPVGVPGELYIGGANVALGYLGEPGLTAERFLPDSEGGANARRYRTGDRVRLEDDGNLTFLGRLDRQVKLRGFRIEPGEIEAVLATRPGVARALAGVVTDPHGERRLIAWVVAERHARLEVASLRQELRQLLPDHLVPAAIAEITEVPLTHNGKVDWAALPSPMPPSGRPAAPPETAARSESIPQGEAAVRRTLAAIWRHLLDRDEIGLDDSFFDIGGHSLLVVRLQERLVAHFDLELPVGELFAHPTLRSLAAHLDRSLRAAPATEEFTL